jgi:cyclin C
MEFYLVDDLECDLVVFHPYRTLLVLCKREANTSPEHGEEGEALDLGTGLDASDGPRYWGTGEGQLELPPGALQVAWFVIIFLRNNHHLRIHRSIINDTYRSQLCLLHPPHLIAIAAIYLSFIIHPPVRPEPHTSDDLEASHRQPRRSSRQASNNHSQESPTSSSGSYHVSCRIERLPSACRFDLSGDHLTLRLMGSI